MKSKDLPASDQIRDYLELARDGWLVELLQEWSWC
jgi:hypothetical protein